MKRKFKLIVPSFLTLIFCLLLIAGSTFAIFSSQAEASIEVTSGKVHVTASLTDLAAFSAEADDTVTNESDNWAGEVTSGLGAGKYKYVEATPVENSETPKFEFATKGTAELTNDKTLILNNIVPGDKVTLKLNLKNSSNVDVKYRVRLNATEDNGLLDGLRVKVNGIELVGTIKNTAWLPLAANEKISDMPLEVLLPITAGNEYQEKTAKLRFTVEMVQANAKVDEVLDLVNAYLAEQNPRNKTMWDAIQDANAWLALPENAGKSFVATNYVWNMDTDQFYAEDNVVTGQGFEGRFFKAYTQEEFEALETQKFSIYAVGEWSGFVDVIVGFDAGDTTGISSVSYVRTGANDKAQEVVIRTNGGTLTVNAPLDTVKHYGEADLVDIQKVASASYHENGTVSLVKVANGRVALESESNVGAIHLAATDGEFDNITVAKAASIEMPDFSRDPVAIPAGGKLVVALQEGTADANAEKDYVWLTAVGVYEQITLGSASAAGTNYAATSESATQEQKTAAQQIANNIKATYSEKEYEVKAVKNGDNWEYQLVSETEDNITENVTVEVTVQNNNATASVTVGETQATASTSNSTVVTEDNIEAVVAQGAAKTFAEIDSKEKLLAFRDAWNSGKLANGTFKLMANIDISGEDWLPIGTWEYPFNGTIDGNGNSIIGLTKTRLANEDVYSKGSSTKYNGVVFGFIAIAGGGDVEVKNLTFANVNINLSAAANVGAVIGYAPKNSDFTSSSKGGTYWATSETEGKKVLPSNYGKDDITLSNVTVSGSISANSHVGGLIGKDYSSGALTLTNCTSEAIVSESAAGGLSAFVAFISSPSSVTFTSCESTENSKLIAAGMSVNYIGDFYGNSDTTATVTSCTSHTKLELPDNGTNPDDVTIRMYSDATIEIKNQTFKSSVEIYCGNFIIENTTIMGQFNNYSGTTTTIKSGTFNYAVVNYGVMLIEDGSFCGNSTVISNYEDGRLTITGYTKIDSNYEYDDKIYCYDGSTITVGDGEAQIISSQQLIDVSSVKKQSN